MWVLAAREWPLQPCFGCSFFARAPQLLPELAPWIAEYPSVTWLSLLRRLKTHNLVAGAAVQRPDLMQRTPPPDPRSDAATFLPLWRAGLDGTGQVRTTRPGRARATAAALARTAQARALGAPTPLRRSFRHRPALLACLRCRWWACTTLAWTWTGEAWNPRGAPAGGGNCRPRAWLDRWSQRSRAFWTGGNIATTTPRDAWKQASSFAAPVGTLCACSCYLWDPAGVDYQTGPFTVILETPDYDKPLAIGGIRAYRPASHRKVRAPARPQS